MKAAPRAFVVPCVVAVLLATGAHAFAQASETWGTTSLSIHTLHAFAFEAQSSGAGFEGDGAGGRYATAGLPCFEAPLVLPSGAIIHHIELAACDTDPATDVGAVVSLCNLSACANTAVVTTTGAAGCSRVASPVGSTVVQNDVYTYSVRVCVAVYGTAHSFKAVRVFYALQVSAAPAVATFPNDVPTTHPFFRFVEAMAKSGLTGGCAPNAFCPDQPVTRGQMAVFLSTALGLHFPN